MSTLDGEAIPRIYRRPWKSPQLQPGKRMAERDYSLCAMDDPMRVILCHPVHTWLAEVRATIQGYHVDLKVRD